MTTLDNRARDRNLLVAVVVRQLHSQRTTLDGYGMSKDYCAECRQAWPCATEQAIIQALAVSGACNCLYKNAAQDDHSPDCPAAVHNERTDA